MSNAGVRIPTVAEKLITRSEAARVLSVSYQTVRRLGQDGTIREVANKRPDGVRSIVRVVEADVHNYLKSSCPKS